jgi:hypothetical protein
MKPFLAIALLFLIACNNAEKKETVIMPGAYMMNLQSIKSSTIDTTYHTLQQLKIYTGEYMMYANFYPRDSTSSFGVGSYDAEKDTVTEHVIYNASDTMKNDSPSSYKLLIVKTDSGYRQVISDMASQGQKITLTEEYKSVGTPVKSPLDGVWKELKTFYIKGKDTTRYNTTQFKAYYGSHYIWGNTYSDSLKKNHTGMGYGKFTIAGANKLKESCITSSYYQVRGQDIDIDFEMNGNDEFKQTISYKDGGKSVEVYQRLKQ